MPDPTLEHGHDAALLDPHRLAALADTGLLPGGVDDVLDRCARAAAVGAAATVGVVNLVGGDRQRFAGAHGVDHLATDLTPSICKHVVMTGEALVVGDATTHPLMRDSLLTQMGVRSYAGLPLRTRDGHVLGTLCAVDWTAREWADAHLGLLDDLAHAAAAQLDLRRATVELTRQATTDVLTGLGNRRALEQALDAACAADGPLTVAVFDLDGFKAYNDTFGHPAGDALLRRLAAALARAVGIDHAFRVGGDEFCVVSAAEPATVVAQALPALAEAGEHYEVHASAGAARRGPDGSTPSVLLSVADGRLYEHKRGRGATRGREAGVLLSVLHERDRALGDHVDGVATLAAAAAEHLGLHPADVARTRLAAQLHDIGKVAVPDAILGKAGPLDAEEWAVMREHTIIGERIVLAAPGLGDVAAIVRASHERWDGGGYPDGLAGEAIPVASRIILVADAFEAMTSDRAYRRARAPHEALAELRACAGTQFDPAAVQALADVLAPAA